MTTSAETPVKKVSTFETGHYKNLAGFPALIESLKSYGALYNPSNTNLSIANLEALKAMMDAAISRVSNAEIASRSTIRERQEAYEGMGSLATRIQNAFASCAAKNEALNAKSYTDKIRGNGKKKTVEVTDEKTKSMSQMSFDSRMKNLKDLCTFIATIPDYKPNETALQPESLTTYINSLSALNGAVNKTWNDLDVGRAERNKIMYDKETGAGEIIKNVKRYVKSVFGARSPEYKRIADIEFKNRKMI